MVQKILEVRVRERTAVAVDGGNFERRSFRIRKQKLSGADSRISIQRMRLRKFRFGRNLLNFRTLNCYNPIEHAPSQTGNPALIIFPKNDGQHMTDTCPPEQHSSIYSLTPFWDAAFDASHNGIMIIDREGYIIKCNKAARRVLALTEIQSGRDHMEIVPEAWPDFQNIMDTGRPQIGKQFRLPHTNIIANRCPILIDGKVVGLISVFQDISEYEAIISQLKGYQKLNQELEAIIESSSDGLFITDGNANTIRVNPAYERITGLQRSNLIGRNMRDLVQERVFDRSVSLEVLEHREVCSMIQVVLGNKTVMVTGNPIFDEKGDIAIVVTNVRDMTELNDLRTKLEETRRLTSRFREVMLEHEQYEHALRDMVIKSEPMARVVKRAVKVAGVETSVLITGESGVGKSMLARIIHQISPRKDRPFVKINCGTIPESLMESELFGYEKGAFTGASVSGKAGLIEMAHTGTVFLDEIGDLKLDMQVKLLQVIEEKTFSRVGATHPQSVDVRIIAATHHDLKELIGKGVFRNDLYYRLNVIPVEIPPLRDRKDDIPALVHRVLAKFNKDSRVRKRLSPEVIDRLMAYHYPGNVRELINIMERILILSEGAEVGLAELPRELSDPMFGEMERTMGGAATLRDMVEAVEAKLIKRALGKHPSISAAARSLGVHPSTLCRKIAQYGISVAEVQNSNCENAI